MEYDAYIQANAEPYNKIASQWTRIYTTKQDNVAYALMYGIGQTTWALNLNHSSVDIHFFSLKNGNLI